MFKRKIIAAMTSAILLPTALAGVIPSEFKHNRVFVTAEAPDGKTLKIYTDTGGGINAISQNLVERYNIASAGKLPTEGGGMPLVNFPSFIEEAGVPLPPEDKWLKGKLVSAPQQRIQYDGFLGSRWFDKGIWAFDYPSQTLEKLDSFIQSNHYTTVDLAFKHNAKGDKQFAFPRFEVLIDGEKIDMLLDTGASAKLSDAAAAHFGLPQKSIVGTSYITDTIYKKWREKHGEWPIIEGAEIGIGKAFPMIQVPSVKLGEHDLGPVWFSVRPDKNFTESMSQMMDKTVHGALGGSAFKSLNMVIDYPASKLHIARMHKQ